MSATHSPIYPAIPIHSLTIVTSNSVSLAKVVDRHPRRRSARSHRVLSCSRESFISNVACRGTLPDAMFEYSYRFGRRFRATGGDRVTKLQRRTRARGVFE